MRKVHKLDIKEEIIAVEDHLREIRYLKYSNDQSKLSDLSKGKTITFALEHDLYKIFELNNPYWIESKFFGIKEDDLFEYILQISYNELDRIKSEEHDIGFKKGYHKGIYNIKQLSWYKRLFNKF